MKIRDSPRLDMEVSENKRIARAAGVVSGLTLVSRVAGLIRDVVISYLFGAGIAAEAFFVAFRFPNLFRRLVAEGAMNVAFVPVFSDLLVRRSRAEAEVALRALLGIAVLALVVTAVLGSLSAPLWVDLFAPGFVDSPELRGLTIRLTRMLFPYVALIGLVSVLAGFLNASRHFIAPALSPAVLNFVIIGCALGLHSVLELPIEALVYGVLIGGSGQLLLQVAVSLRRNINLRPLWRPRHDAVGRILRLLVPAMLGTAIFQINVLLGTVLASLLSVGSVSYLWYADRVFEFPLGLFVVALGTAALPSMSSQASRGEYREVANSLAFAIGLMNFVAIPATIGLLILASPITAVLFERGAFTAIETAMTAKALRCYAVGLWSVSVVRLLAPTFYALGDARTPVAVAGVTVVANAVASLLLMGPVAPGSSPAWLANLINSVSLADLDHAGIALATSIAATTNALLLGLFLAKRIGGLRRDVVFGSLLRSAAASVPMALSVLAVQRLLASQLTGAVLPIRALALAATIGIGVAMFGVAAVWIGGPEVDRARRLIAERLAKTSV